ncbi:MAG: hypothetical protein WCJ71_00555 [Candidatus Omnitrophota bacterium]
MKNNDRKTTVLVGILFALVFLSWASQGYADMKEIKAYKGAFPEAKVKCATCHSVALPKTGSAGLNEYGQAAVAANPHPTAETFKQVGKAEDFKK